MPAILLTFLPMLLKFARRLNLIGLVMGGGAEQVAHSASRPPVQTAVRDQLPIRMARPVQAVDADPTKGAAFAAQLAADTDAVTRTSRSRPTSRPDARAAQSQAQQVDDQHSLLAQYVPSRVDRHGGGLPWHGLSARSMADVVRAAVLRSELTTNQVSVAQYPVRRPRSIRRVRPTSWQARSRDRHRRPEPSIKATGTSRALDRRRIRPKTVGAPRAK